MEGFYEAFYEAVSHSPVYDEFCTRAFGRNLCQHGFADVVQLNRVIGLMHLHADQRVLDVGCGNGMIDEYISDCTGADVTGLDVIPQAIYQARQRTIRKQGRLAFAVADINALDLPAHHYDAVISVDSIYFSDDYIRSIYEFAQSLRPGGQIGILYSYGSESVPKDEFTPESLMPDCTPLARAFVANQIHFRSWNLTHEDYCLAQERRQILAALRPRFEAEGICFIWDNRMAEAEHICDAVEKGQHVRYLYIAHICTPPSPY